MHQQQLQELCHANYPYRLGWSWLAYKHASRARNFRSGSCSLRSTNSWRRRSIPVGGNRPGMAMRCRMCIHCFQVSILYIHECMHARTPTVLYITLHYITLHCITLRCIVMHYSICITGVRSIHTTIPGRARPPGRKFWEQTKDCKRLTKMEVVRFTDDWAHGSCDANELTWNQRHERMNEWTNEWQKDCRKKGKIEWLSQRKKESVHEWMCEWMNAWMRNECMNDGRKEGINASMGPCIDEPLNQWLNGWMNQWINESVNQWTIQWQWANGPHRPAPALSYHPLSATSLLGYNFRSFCNPILLVALPLPIPVGTTRKGPPRENNLILWWVPTGSKLIYSGLDFHLWGNLKPLNPPLALWPKSFSCSVTFGVHPPLQHVQIWNPAPQRVQKSIFWRSKRCVATFLQKLFPVWSKLNRCSLTFAFIDFHFLRSSKFFLGVATFPSPKCFFLPTLAISFF